MTAPDLLICQPATAWIASGAALNELFETTGFDDAATYLVASHGITRIADAPEKAPS